MAVALVFNIIATIVCAVGASYLHVACIELSNHYSGLECRFDDEYGNGLILITH